MKKIAYLCGGLLLAASLTACSAAGESGSSAMESSRAEVSSAPESSSIPRESVTEPGPQAMDLQVFVQKDSGAEEGYEPTIRLLGNGNFEFSAYLYDGTVILSGTYAADGEEGYVLTPVDSTAKGEEGSGVREIRLTKTGQGVVYSGQQVGVTFDGAEFLTAEN